MPRDVDRREARKSLEQSLEHYDRRTIGFIHYEHGPIGESKSVYAVAVKFIDEANTQYFSAEHDEEEALASFSEYMDKRSRGQYLWCTWNMRSSVYGFPHLDERLSKLTNGRKRIAMPSATLDLDEVCWQLYGDVVTGGQDKLPYLCTLNGITTQWALWREAVQENVEAGKWVAIEASVVRKVEMVLAIWSRMVEDTLLVTSATAPGNNDGKSRIGVSLQDAAELLLPPDASKQEKAIKVKRWQNTRRRAKLEPIGKDVAHPQRNLFDIDELMEFLKVEEGKRPGELRKLRKRLKTKLRGSVG